MTDDTPTGGTLTSDDSAAYDYTLIPDYDQDFVDERDIAAFASALSAPDNPATSPDGQEDETNGQLEDKEFITALNDWRPVHQRVRRPIAHASKRRRKKPRRGKDETREGFVYGLLKGPLLVLVLAWIIFLGAIYLVTRSYIAAYEYAVVIRGKRHKLRQAMHQAPDYASWVDKAKQMDSFLGNDEWKTTDDYAYYNSDTVRNVRNQLRSLRLRLKRADTSSRRRAEIADELRVLIEASVKNNFVGVEGPRLYSETFYGTKDLVQSFIDEVEACLEALSKSDAMPAEEKTTMYRHLHTNYGRTALCLSGGACFAYYHFGVAKALLDAGVLPEVITGTSGGALVAALLCTKKDEELKKILVPALANRITACHDAWHVWIRRWWRTGARFDAVDWARRSAWFCHGNLTFREAYRRTGRILNVTCVPSDPHTPTILANYKTSPDCVIWSAILASAAVPGILNPVVLMKKNRNGTLSPYSFGHKWKDGSLRTDIPLKQLNTYFNVSFSIVSQANPHINLFFFSSRGTVGKPVSHRRGRGWRGGFLGSAVEQYIKLDLAKWLKVLRHLELLPRYLGQDWSEIWLQHFSGTITIWPKSIVSDYWNILSDPDPPRLARMLHVGQLSTFPKLKFISNRIKVERLIEAGRRAAGVEVFEGDNPVEDEKQRQRLVRSMLSQEDMQVLLAEARRKERPAGMAEILSSIEASGSSGAELSENQDADAVGQDAGDFVQPLARIDSPSLSQRLSSWWPSSSRRKPGAEDSVEDSSSKTGVSTTGQAAALGEVDWKVAKAQRRSSLLEELSRQGSVFFDDPDREELSEADPGAGSSVAGSTAGSTAGSAIEDDDEEDEEFGKQPLNH